jgi:transcriptional regulator with XRE-family HTH domain
MRKAAPMPRKQELPPLSPEQGALGDAIKAIMAERGINRDELAAALKMEVGQLGKYIRGRGNPRYLTILKICHGLGVEPGVLLTRADELRRSGA